MERISHLPCRPTSEEGQGTPKRRPSPTLSPEATLVAPAASSVPPKRSAGLSCGFAIVEEDEEDEEGGEDVACGGNGRRSRMGSDDALAPILPHSPLPPHRPISRHSSASSLVDTGSKTTSAITEAAAAAAIIDISNLAATLKQAQDAASAEAQQQQATPAPFPVSSQIGTGGLSRQGSLRRAASSCSSRTQPLTTSSASAVQEEAASQASGVSSSSQSPSTPPGSAQGSAQSSAHASPAKYKVSLNNKKLVSTRSSPQLILKQTVRGRG